MSRLIGVAGNLGSGKTSLARALAGWLGWQMRPEGPYDPSYFDDFFKDEDSLRRWSFETQVAILSHKVALIKEAARAGVDVVDRTVYEDVDVFAKLWADTGKMDFRAHSTYEMYAEVILDEVMPPLAIVYCHSSPEECEARLAARPRPYQSRYPEGHLERLHARYEVWATTFDLCPVLAIDTMANDVREPAVTRRVAQELALVASGGLNQQARQLELLSPLLGELPPEIGGQLQLLRLANGVESASRTRLSIRRSGQAPPPISADRTVYIAAPFTSETAHVDVDGSDSPEMGQPKLLEHVRPHGIIPAGDYRSTLSELSAAFERMGYRAVLPHRDVNAWGDRELTPKQIGKECVDLVEQCDLFFGIPGSSFGVHVEAGIAIALTKPTILASVESMQGTFMGTALMASGYAAVVTARDLRHLVQVVNSAPFNEILDRAGAIARDRQRTTRSETWRS